MTLIDIIIGVKNEEKHIEKCITSMQNQSIKDIKIIVVDGLSHDKTPQIVKKLKKEDNRIELLTNKNEIISSARNIGLNASNADFVAYIDGHTFVDSDWIEILYNAFINYEKKCKLGCVGSTYAIPQDEKILGKVIDFCFKTIFGGFGTSYTYDEHIKSVDTVAFGLYKRDILEKLKVRYDEKMTHCEDTDFNYKLIKKGYILLKHPKAFVYQYKRENLKEFYKQMFNYGMGRARFMKKYPQTGKIFMFVPLIIVIYLLFIIIGIILFAFSLINLQTLFIIAIPAILYIIVDLYYSLTCMIKFKSIKALLAFFVYPIEHLGYGLGFLKSLITE